jgi:hypothetical protein
MRTVRGSGASFLFTVVRDYNKDATFSDASRTAREVPLYRFDSVETIMLPARCVLVGVELTEDAIDLPSFAHPRQAAYVLGRERGSLTPEMLARCAHVIRIPTSLCLNQATARPLGMYDRLPMLGRWPVRPDRPRGEPNAPGPSMINAFRKLLRPTLRQQLEDGVREALRRYADRRTAPDLRVYASVDLVPPGMNHNLWARDEADHLRRFAAQWAQDNGIARAGLRVEVVVLDTKGAIKLTFGNHQAHTEITPLTRNITNVM